MRQRRKPLLWFSLKSLTIACVVAACVIGHYRKPVARFLNLDGESALLIDITTARQMDDALAAPNAVIFARVDWSTHSAVGLHKLTNFARHWRQARKTRIEFFVIDLTDAQADTSPYVAEWLSSDSRLSGLPVRGSGDVVWLKKGAFQKWLPAYNATADDLEEVSDSIFNN